MLPQSGLITGKIYLLKLWPLLVPIRANLLMEAGNKDLLPPLSASSISDCAGSKLNTTASRYVLAFIYLKGYFGLRLQCWEVGGGDIISCWVTANSSYADVP